MTVSYFVRYQGATEDDAAFLARYRDVHVPLLLRFPKIRAVVLHRGATSADPYPVEPGRDLLTAELVFDSLEDLEAALKSDARAEARKDFASFPAFHGAVTHQAMTAEEFRP